MMDAAASSTGGSVSVRGLRKRYGSTVALAGIDLDLVPGEIIGIAGPNGAGKSTFVRIIAGEEAMDEGTITMGGAPWSPLTNWTSVAVVHQEPQLFPNLTVAENMLAGREGTSTRRPRLGDSDRALMDALEIGRLADVPLADCSLATQQRIEIARALARDARIFLFDEPNSALTREESNELFREMRKIADAGRIVILVTHRLSDFVENCRRVAVIRDGTVRSILEGAALTEDGIAEQLVTGSVNEQAVADGRRVTRDGDEIFRVRNWSHESKFTNVEFSLAKGEIVAFMGVEGSGARELLRSFAGIERCAGQATFAGDAVNATGDAATAALRTGTAYVPATRQYSLYSNFSVGENLIARLGRPEIAGALLGLRKRRMKEIAESAVSRFLVKTRNLAQGIRSLSGGNQQKVAIAQALVCEPRLILLEEPTRGVDVQSKREIYRLLDDFAGAGNAAVIFCTEVLEVFEAADRVLVIADGRLSRSLRVRDYDHVEKLATDVSNLERHFKRAEVA
jgi:ABC-type sugar transport system ATPase subunit